MWLIAIGCVLLLEAFFAAMKIKHNYPIQGSWYAMCVGLCVAGMLWILRTDECQDVVYMFAFVLNIVIWTILCISALLSIVACVLCGCDAYH